MTTEQEKRQRRPGGSGAGADVVFHAEANWFHRAMRHFAATRVMAWVFAHTAHHLDRITLRLTGGRTTFAALLTGLPVVMLTTIGARSGKRRTVPVLGLPHDGKLAVIGSNFGQRPQPGWYHNLNANPRAEVERSGVTTQVVARPATADERERLWKVAVTVYPGWPKYERRAAHRTIGMFILEPTG